jgi:hypothetical protein
MSRFSELENELDGLDIPALSADILVDTVCSELQLDPIEMMRKFDENSEDPEIPSILRALLCEVLESSTQIPHIRRALEIGAEMLELEN